MGVAVLPPEDFLRKHHFHKPTRNPNPNPNPNPNRSSRRRRSSPPPKAGSQTRPASPPVSAPIRILKRGEDIPQPKKPEPAMRSDRFFAGSTVTSPPPSSVPLPVFFTAARRNCGLGNNQEIESELKKVLRLL